MVWFQPHVHGVDDFEASMFVHAHPTHTEWQQLLGLQASTAVELAGVKATLAAVLRALNQLTNQGILMSESITDYGSILTTFSQDLATNNSAVDSAVAMLGQLKTQLGEAIASAQAANASPEQLAALTALHEQWQAKSQMLANALVASTPAAPDMTPEDVAQTPDAPVEPVPDAPAEPPAPTPEPPVDAAPVDPAPAEPAPVDPTPAPVEIDPQTGLPVQADPNA